MITKRCLCVGLRGSVSEAARIAEDESSLHIAEFFVGAPPEMGPTGRFKGTFPTSLASIQEMAALAHARGIELNVLINIPCVSQQEFDPAYLDKFREFIAALEQAGVDWLTLAHSMLIKVAVATRRTLKINTSTYNHIDSPLLAKEFEKLGVDRINLRQNTNRNLALIKRIARYTALPLELYVNSRCVNAGFCPYAIAHANFKSHHQLVCEQDWDRARDPYVSGFCGPRRKSNMVDLLFTSTIRPEDIHFFEEAGVAYFKLATRTVEPEQTLKYIRAYGERRFNGDFGELYSMDARAAKFSNRLLDGLFESVKDRNEEDQLAAYQKFADTNRSLLQGPF